MGAIQGTIDGAALTGLARGDGATRLGDLPEEEAARLRLCFHGEHGTELPFELRGAPVLWNEDENEDGNDDEDEPTDVGGFVIHAHGDSAVAFAGRHAAPARWCYLGKVSGHPALRRAALLVGYGGDWPGLWKDAASVGASVLVDGWRRAIRLDGAGRELGLYVGFDGDEAVAIVLDAGGLGGLRDDRDGEEDVRAAFATLAATGATTCTIQRRYRVDAFIPNLADGVPRLDDFERLGPIELSGELVGTLPLPSRTLGIVLGHFARAGGDRLRVAGDTMDALAFYEQTRGDLSAWLLRVPGAPAPVRWCDGGFEDVTVIGDGTEGGGRGTPSLEVPDHTWPPGLVGFTRNHAGAPLFCVRGPDLSVARAVVGLDETGAVTTMIVVS